MESRTVWGQSVACVATTSVTTYQAAALERDTPQSFRQAHKVVKHKRHGEDGSVGLGRGNDTRASGSRE